MGPLRGGRATPRENHRPYRSTSNRAIPRPIALFGTNESVTSLGVRTATVALQDVVVPTNGGVVTAISGPEQESPCDESDHVGLAAHCCWSETHVDIPFTSARIGRVLGQREFIELDPPGFDEAIVVEDVVVEDVMVDNSGGAYV